MLEVNKALNQRAQPPCITSSALQNKLRTRRTRPAHGDDSRKDLGLSSKAGSGNPHMARSIAQAIMRES